jgi:hypothetical protein
MPREPLHEDLLDALTRLVGRPRPVVQEALARLIGGLSRHLGHDLLGAMGPFPLTSWHALCPRPDAARQVWADVQGAGLSAEEVFTALAVVDDHVRRRYGSDAWARLDDWSPNLAGRYDLPIPHAGQVQRKPVLTTA